MKSLRRPNHRLRPSLAVTVSANPRFHDQRGDFGTDPIGQPFWFSGFQTFSNRWRIRILRIRTANRGGPRSDRAYVQLWFDVIKKIVIHLDRTSTCSSLVINIVSEGFFCCDGRNNQSFQLKQKRRVLKRDTEIYINRNMLMTDRVGKKKKFPVSTVETGIEWKRRRIGMALDGAKKCTVRSS